MSSSPPVMAASTPIPKIQKSNPHCVKGFADDLTIISQHEQEHASALHTVSNKCSDIDLEIRPDKCVSVVYSGSKIKKTCSFPIGEGHTRNLSSGAAARFLGHTLAHSLSVQRNLSSEKITNLFINMLEKVNEAPLRGEHKLWIYKRYLVLHSTSSSQLISLASPPFPSFRRRP